MSSPTPQASRIAHDYICESCRDAVAKDAGIAILQAIRDELSADPRKAFFDARDKGYEPYEAKFRSMMQKHWAEELRILIANLKKLKRTWGETKDPDDVVDSVLYPVEAQKKKLAADMLALITIMLDELGQIALAELEVDIAFDVAIPGVAEWIKNTSFYFAEELENGSVDKIRRIITGSMEKGETIPETIQKLRDEFTDWSEYRAERISRTEAIRAGNRANLEAYIQSGVVERKEWHANPGACDFCAPLDGKTISLEKTFFDKGDKYTVEVDGKPQTMKLDYDETPCPPLHPNCRCAILPVTYED